MFKEWHKSTEAALASLCSSGEEQPSISLVQDADELNVWQSAHVCEDMLIVSDRGIRLSRACVYLSC